MRALHGWLAFVFALPLVLVSLSGATLGFARETDRMFNVDLLGAPFSAAAPRPSGELLASAQAVRPDARIIGFAPSATPVDAAMVLAQDVDGLRHEVYIHPRTGEVRGQRDSDSGFYGFALRLHSTLLLDETGRWLIRLAALGLLLTTLSGLVLRGRTTSSHVAARTHPLLGMTTAPILAMIGASGLAFLAWQPGFGNIQLSAMHAPSVAMTIEDASAALEALQTERPDCRLRWLDAHGETLRLACEEPGHAGTTGMRMAIWTPSEGLDFLRRPESVQQGSQIGEFMYNLHTGELLGMPGRILWVIASLAVPFLVLGGLASRRARLKHAHHE